MKKLKSYKTILAGLFAGFLNGLFGAGGGMIAVPFLMATGTPQKKAHATSIAIMLPISIMSAVIYFLNKSMHFHDVLPFLPGAVFGTIVGTFVLKKATAVFVRRIFGTLLIFSAVRILFFI